MSVDPYTAFSLGAYDEAAAAFSGLSAQNPGDIDIMLAWANALSHGGRKLEAASVIERAVDHIDNATVSALRTLHQLSVANGPANVRRAVARRLYELTPEEHEIGLELLSADPQFRLIEWREELSRVAKLLLSKPDVELQTLDLLSQLAAGAEDLSVLYEASGRLARAYPSDDRHLLTWIQSAIALGPLAFPEAIISVVCERHVTNQLAKLLMDFARSCEVTGQLDSVLKIYRVAAKDAETRIVAARSASRLALLLEGRDGLRKLFEELSTLYGAEDKQLARVFIGTPIQ
ncbi:MAG: tetratricopeptide repeat protein, partial [Rhodoplanes sp.]